MSVQTMAAVWRGSRHGGSALLMMLAIADFSDDKGVAYPSVGTLAEKTRMKPRNAHYLLSELQASGELIIRVGAGPRGTNLYRIALDRLQGVQAVAGVQPSAGLQQGAGVQGCAGVQPSARGGALQCAHPLHHSAPKPSLNHQEPSHTSFARRQTPRTPNCPNEKIVDLFHEVLPELPRVKVVDTKNRKAKLAEFWRWVLTSTRTDGARRATTAEEALAWTKAYFERARQNDFLMGNTPRAAGHETWRCTLDFLLSEKGRLQVIERTEVPA